MNSSSKIRKGSRNMKYKKISHDQRTHIINELTKNGKTLKEVSEETQLKPSTVKAILQVYLKEGRIGKKSTRDRKVKLLNTTVIALIDKTKNSEYAIENLQFIHPLIRINQQSSEISHNGQTLTETQQNLDQYSKQLVMMQVKDFLREKKSEIVDQLANPLAKQNFLNQLAQFEVSEQLPFQELKKEQLSAEDEQFLEKILSIQQFKQQYYLLKLISLLEQHNIQNPKQKSDINKQIIFLLRSQQVLIFKALFLK